MVKETFAIGLMSGTSIDGLDICCAKFSERSGTYSFEILAAQTLPYPGFWETKLRSAPYLSSADLLATNSEYGFYLGKCADKFIKDNKLRRVDLIASHGHTVFHQPERRFTYQIGDGRAIRHLTGITTIYDFRSEDVLLGGNGAPLVPIGDAMLFGDYDACLNLGGFSNISFEKKGRRIAFDICPVNIVLNHFAEKLDLPYDEGGKLAKSGKTDAELLRRLNTLDFYARCAPKSLGAEWVFSEFLPLIDNADTTDVLATITEHVAIQIAMAIKNKHFKNILVTGGGAYNSYLISRLKTMIDSEIAIPAGEIVNYKEALIFAFLGMLKIQGKINVYASVTGADRDSCSGIIV